MLPGRTATGRGQLCVQPTDVHLDPANDWLSRDRLAGHRSARGKHLGQGRGCVRRTEEEEEDQHHPFTVTTVAGRTVRWSMSGAATGLAPGGSRSQLPSALR